MTQQLDNVYAVASQGHTILEQGLFEESDIQKYPLGHILRLNDGRTIKYAKAGEALGAGKLCQSSTPMNIVMEDLAVNAAAILDTSLTVTLGATTAVAANELAGGYCVVCDDTGEGHTYKIKSNTGAAVNLPITVTLFDPIRVAFGADTTVTLVVNELFKVEVNDVDDIQLPVGVAPIAVTSGYYFWLHTYGVIGVLTAGTLVKGEPVQGMTTDGAVGPVDYDAAGVNTQIVGTVLQVSADTEYSPIFIRIAS